MGEIISNFPTGAEDITPEIHENRNLIETAIEQMAGRKTGADINPEDVLLGKKGYKGQELVVGTFDKDAFEQEVAEANRNGKYVWKKYEYRVQSSDITVVQQNTGTSVRFKFSSDKIDFSKLEISFFVGMEILGNVSSTDILQIISETEANYKYNNSKGAIQWNKETQELIFTSTTNFVSVHTWKVTSPSEIYGDFLSYTTSDDPTAYPDNGEKDGYWWEKVQVTSRQGVFVNATDSEGFPTDMKIVMDIVPSSAFSSYSTTYQTVFFFKYLKTLEIVANIIKDSAFEVSLNDNADTKIKLKVGSIRQKAFKDCINCKFWISSECTSIDGSSYVFNPFYGYSANSIYCEAESKPSGWGTYWNSSSGSETFTTHWGVTEAEFDAL